tara:strand:- start:3229 stop:3846 length:618 start_codon:yes stop_codon:yes gene_type:complete
MGARKINREILRQIILEQVDSSADATSDNVKTVIYFYPGLRPESGKDSVKDYLIQKTGDSASIEYVDGHMLLRVDKGLFVIPTDHTVPFSELEEIASSRVNEYEKTKKLLGGYSAGSAGVADAQNNNSTRFDAVVLADPEPRNDISWDILTYNPGSWSAYDWYPRRLKRMLRANPNSAASERKKWKHHEHMNRAIDSMLFVARAW